MVIAARQATPQVIEIPGRLGAVRTAEVRARVNGILQRRLYEEGTDVRADQPLFEIDPRELRAQLSAVQAALDRAQATAANAVQEVKRYDGLVAQQAISQQEYDTAVARLRTAEADVSQARAQVEAAVLNLSYATVNAPIAGRAGRAEVTEGALVSAAEATLLTRVEQLDPIFVNFSLSSADLLAVQRAIASGALVAPALNQVPVHVILEDGREYGRTGRMNFADFRIDETTGSTALRAVLPNPERALLPGQFVRVRGATGVRSDTILVPQRAVTVTPRGALLMVVGAKDVVESRDVTVGALQGEFWVILSGLAAGERVIVDGLQQAQPGRTVRVVTTDTAQPSGPGAGASPPAPASDRR